MDHFKKAVLICSSFLVLSGCDFFQKKDPLPGERMSFLDLATGIQADPLLKGVLVSVPSAKDSNDWPQALYNFDRTFTPFLSDLPLEEKTKVSIGSGSSTTEKLLSYPIVYGNHIYVSDSIGHVSCLDKNTFAVIWHIESYKEDAKDNKTGVCLAATKDAVIITTGVGEVIAVNHEKGQEIWRMSTGAPIRSAAAVVDGKVIVTTLDNRTIAFDFKTAKILWEHQGLMELSGVFGGAEPIVKDDIVIASYSSGEVFVLRSDSGQVLWSDTLTSALRIDSISSLPHIVGNPIIDANNRVYVTSHGSRMAAFDLTSGQIVWQQEIGSTKDPLLVGDVLFVISNNGELVCLQKTTGKVYYAVTLPKDDDKKILDWTSPLAVNGSIVLANSKGNIYSISIADGKLSKLADVKESVSVQPIVVDRKLYVLGDDGTLFVLGKKKNH